jgi:general secretion pathway protein G
MKNCTGAFTFIEVLIVAFIVAVLAGTIIPQFSMSTREAKLSNLKFNLHTVRAQLELYKEQHRGIYPPAATGADFKDQITRKTGQDTKLDGAKGTCGPYLQSDVPLNPFNHSLTVAILGGDTEPTAPTGTSDGWQYNPAHGWFYPNNAEYFQNAGGFGSPN